MVVIARPTPADTGKEHDRTGSPSTWTVQAPQRAIPHPNLVPVRPSCSRSTQSSGVSGSTSMSCVVPLTVNLGIALPFRWANDAEPQVVPPQRHRAEAAPRGREDRVGEGGGHGDGARLRDTPERRPTLNELSHEVWRLREVGQLVHVEVALDNRAPVKGDLGLAVGESEDNPGCDIGFGDPRIENPATVHDGRDA